MPMMSGYGFPKGGPGGRRIHDPIMPWTTQVCLGMCRSGSGRSGRPRRRATRLLVDSQGRQGSRCLRASWRRPGSAWRGKRARRRLPSARPTRPARGRPGGRQVQPVFERAQLFGHRFEPEALPLRIDDEERFGRLGDDDLLPRHVL